jgi:hypothetical protein
MIPGLSAQANAPVSPIRTTAELGGNVTGAIAAPMSVAVFALSTRMPAVHGSVGWPRAGAMPTAPPTPTQPQAPVGAGAASAAGSASSGSIFVALAIAFLWGAFEVSRRLRLLPELRRPPLVLHSLERPG